MAAPGGAAAAAAASGGMSTPLIIGAVVVIIAIVAGAALLLSHGPSSTNHTGSSSSGTGSGTGSGASGTGSSGTGTSPGSSSTNANCGPGNYCLSQSEMASLMGGTGGNYSAVYGDKSTYLAQAFAYAGQSSTNTIALFNNVTGVYFVGYNQTNKTAQSSSSGTFTLELVLTSPNAQDAQWLYKNMINGTSNGGFNATNATLGGLTYSYVGVSMPPSGGVSFSESLLYGHKDNAAVFVWSFGKTIDQTSLATAISGDIP